MVALYAFAVFGWELIVMLLLDPLWRSTGSSLGALLHWGVTALGWTVGSLLIIRAMRQPRRGLDGTHRAAPHGYALARTLGVVAAVVLAIGLRALALQEWKLVEEYGRIVDDHGTRAPLVFACLLLYYLSETIVIVLVLALGQRAGELRFGSPAFPWGGLVLAVTWGATHVLLQGPATGIYAMGASLLYGVIYCLGNRRLASTFAIVALAFIL